MKILLCPLLDNHDDIVTILCCGNLKELCLDYETNVLFIDKL